MRDHFGQILGWFVEAVFGTDPIELPPSPTWTDDDWFLDQDRRVPMVNEGWWNLRPGEATGRVVGDNLRTLNLLAGRPVLANADFGHTSPLATLPIGGTAALVVGPTTTLTITEH